MNESIIVAKTESFRIEIDANRVTGETVIRPVGRVSEDVGFDSALKAVVGVAPKQVMLDLSKVTGINSSGVRSWIQFVAKLQAKVDCQFIGMSDIFVEQANMIPNMLGQPHTLVLAFNAPYSCPNCNAEFVEVLKPRDVKVAGGKFVAPSFKCQNCSNPLEFDAVEAEYFSFLKNRADK
jgi:anti-anti-sigma regulatory factor